MLLLKTVCNKHVVSSMRYPPPRTFHTTVGPVSIVPGILTSLSKIVLLSLQCRIHASVAPEAATPIFQVVGRKLDTRRDFPADFGECALVVSSWLKKKK